MLPALTTTDEIAAKLAEHARHARGAYSSETERAVRNDTSIFSAWCIDNDHQMLPASAETLVAYIDAMSETVEVEEWRGVPPMADGADP